jgi:hypothetical protein
MCVRRKNESLKKYRNPKDQSCLCCQLMAGRNVGDSRKAVKLEKSIGYWNPLSMLVGGGGWRFSGQFVHCLLRFCHAMLPDRVTAKERLWSVAFCVWRKRWGQQVPSIGGLR